MNREDGPDNWRSYVLILAGTALIIIALTGLDHLWSTR